MKNRPKACLFDLDGVLLNTEPLNRRTWYETARYFDKELNENQLNSFLGRRKVDCAKDIIKWSNLNINLEALIEVQKSFHKKILKEVKPIRGAEILVKYCFMHSIPMALVTSSTKRSVLFKSRNYKFIKLIEVAIYGDTKGLINGKPSPEPYLLAAKTLNANPKLCWAIEDSRTGLESALGAGCKVWEFRKDLQIANDIQSINNKHLIINNLETVLKELKKLQ